MCYVCIYFSFILEVLILPVPSPLDEFVCVMAQIIAAFCFTRHSLPHPIVIGQVTILDNF